MPWQPQLQIQPAGLLLPFVLNFDPYICTSFLTVVPDCNIQVMHTTLHQGDQIEG